MIKKSLALRNKINPRITAIRNHFDLTKREMAKRLNIPVTTLSTIENGKQLPTLAHITSLIDIFKISPTWLLKGEGETFVKEKEKELEMKAPEQLKLFKKVFPQVPAEAEVIEAIERMAVPIVRKAMLARDQELKELFKSQIEEYHKAKTMAMSGGKTKVVKGER